MKVNTAEDLRLVLKKSLYGDIEVEGFKDEYDFKKKTNGEHLGATAIDPMELQLRQYDLQLKYEHETRRCETEIEIKLNEQETLIGLKELE